MDVDEATSAMIAQVLAEENPYQIQEFDEVYDDPDDSDYSGTPRRKKARKNPRGAGVAGKSKGRAVKTSAPKTPKIVEEEPEDNLEAVDGRTATGRRKRKDTGVRRAKGRSWTSEEEQLFLEGLELYGRDWKACAKHVGTRDAKSLTSHAQKHFIKLCMKGLPLPAKVKESGSGYTLSGKLLDPTSTSAKAYGFNPHVLKDLTEDEYKISVSGVLVDKLSESETVIPAPGRRRKPILVAELDPHARENIAPAEGKGTLNSTPRTDSTDRAQVETNGARDAPDSSQSLGDWTNVSHASANDAAVNQDTQPCLVTDPKSNKSAAPSVSRAEAVAQPTLSPPVMTDYARARPRRAMSTKKLHMGETTESLDLVECLNFVGVAGSRSVGAQPFSLDVSNQALLVIDCHSHLSECEIIGLLGGHWNPDARHLTVVEAFPCARETGSEARTSVELGPEAEVQARAKMQSQGLTSVGWYHSHPVFEPAPSKKDMENQRNYQALFRDEVSRSEPFVGFIVGPYDAQLLAPRSALSAFVVQEKDGCLNPYKIQYSLSKVDEDPTAETVTKLHTIFDDLKSDVARVDLSQMWRPFTSLKDGQPEGPALTKIQKFQASIQAYFPQDRESEAESFVCNLCKYIEKSWNVKLGLTVLEEAEPPVTQT